MNVLEIGDSNANSTRIDTIWSGHPVQSGWTYRHNGVNESTYPTGILPGVGKVPYLIDLIDVGGACPGWYIRRGTNGGKVPGPLHAQWLGAMLDVAALGGVPDLVVVVFGSNDAKILSDAESFQTRMTGLVDRILTAWPVSKVVLCKERCSDADSVNPYGHPYLRSHIYPALSAIDVAYADVQVADGTSCGIVDGIHWGVCGVSPGACGQRCVAELVYSLWS